MGQYKGTHRLGVGVFFIAFGILYLLANLNIINPMIKDVLFSWPMIPVFVGVVHLIKGELITAFIGLGLGAIFIVPDFIGGFSVGDVIQFWPVLLILIGFSFLFKKKGKCHHNWDRVDTFDADVMNEDIVFGGKKINIESRNFKGGKISAVFGGAEINFLNCDMDTNGAVIDLSAVFGGVKMIIPKEWQVKVEVASVLGGFADKRLMFPRSSEQAKTLIIKGSVVFGGGEISSI